MKGKDIMLKRYVIAIGITIGLFVMSGCNAAYKSKNNLTNQNWGKSFETAGFMQTLDPDAGKNADPVVGLSGEAVIKTVDAYHEGFGKAGVVVSTDISTTDDD